MDFDKLVTAFAKTPVKMVPDIMKNVEELQHDERTCHEVMERLSTGRIVELDVSSKLVTAGRIYKCTGAILHHLETKKDYTRLHGALQAEIKQIRIASLGKDESKSLPPGLMKKIRNVMLGRE